MTTYLDTEKIASLVRKKRGNRGLREVSKETSISVSTLSRIENGKLPDMETFGLLCDWLKVPPCLLFGNTEDIQLDTFEAISIQIRSDQNLDPAIAHVLLTLIKAAYRDLTQKQ